MVGSMPQPPALTTEQRQAALQKAARVRRERAEVKEKLKLGSLSLPELLQAAEGDETIGKMKVVSVLESLPGLGKVKARRLMETVGISETRRLQGLGAKQRADLLRETAADPLIFVLIGPGGVGKGTVAERLVARDPGLWLSRSWTTRPQRPGEADDAYVFVDRDAFEAHRAAGGFFESAEFLENLYGTPHPHGPSGSDVLLEIDVEGARQVLDRRPDATVILLVPPSLEEQEARMAGGATTPSMWPPGSKRGRAEVEGGRQ